jgi:hypothetical protein
VPSVRRWPKFCSNAGIGSSGGFGPALPNGRYEFLLVLSHLTDERLIGRIFVCGRQEDHFCEDWREIDSLRPERVNKLAAVRWVAIGGDDSMSDQLLQPVRQNIRCDSLVGTKELYIRSESPQFADTVSGYAVIPDHLAVAYYDYLPRMPGDESNLSGTAVIPGCASGTRSKGQFDVCPHLSLATATRAHPFLWR